MTQCNAASYHSGTIYPKSCRKTVMWLSSIMVETTLDFSLLGIPVSPMIKLTLVFSLSQHTVSTSEHMHICPQAKYGNHRLCGLHTSF